MPPATEPRPQGLLRLGPAAVDVHPAPGDAAEGHLRGGLLVPVLAADGAWTRVLTPCERMVWIRDTSAGPVAGTVAIDPGHGGDEPGAVGPAGLVEKDLDLDVGRRAGAALRAQGVEAVLTRCDDYRATLAFRTAVAEAMRAQVLVSIHHNAEPDGTAARPGTETYHQHASASSRRLAGLLYEEMVVVLEAAGGPGFDWVSNTDAGAKWRLNAAGRDYYGMLRRPAAVGIPACLTEFAFLSNPPEEALLRRDDVRQAQADAIARAVVRFLRTGDPGSGFTTPVERVRPAGPGGGLRGCADPS